MGRVIMSGIVPTLKAPSTGILAQALPVGSTVKLMENGTAVEYLVVNQGIPETAVYDASCDGTWLMRKDCPVLRQIYDTEYNVYAGHIADTYLNGDFYNSLDSVAQSVIKQVKIPYVTGAGSNSVLQTGANGLPRKVFLPSGTELGTSHYYIKVEGARLSYFPESTVATSQRVSNWNGSPVEWWTRSPRVSGSGNMWMIGQSGELSEAGVTNWKALRPTFVILKNSLFSTSGILKGAA